MVDLLTHCLTLTDNSMIIEWHLIAYLFSCPLLTSGCRMRDERVCHGSCLTSCTRQIIELLLFYSWVLCIAVWLDIKFGSLCHYKTLIRLHIKSTNMGSSTKNAMLWPDFIMIDKSIANIKWVVNCERILLILSSNACYLLLVILWQVKMSWRESKASYKNWLLWYLPTRLSWVALSFLRWCQVPHHPILQMVSHLSMLLCLSSLILNLSCSYCYYDSINYLLFWMIIMKAFECFHNESIMKRELKFQMKLSSILAIH